MTYTPPAATPHPLMLGLQSRYAHLHPELQKMFSGYQMSSPHFEMIFEYAGAFITREMVDTFLQDIQQAIQHHAWSSSIVLALLHNPQLALSDLIDPRRPVIYRNIIFSFGRILEQRHVWDSHFSLHDFFQAFLNQQMFQALSDDELRTVLYALQDHVRDQAFNDVIVDVLKSIDYPSFGTKIPHQLLVSAGQLYFDEGDAHVLIESLKRCDEYRLYELGFLVNTVASLPALERNSFMLRDCARLLRSASQREQLYFALAQRVPKSFGYVYLRNQDKLLEKYPSNLDMRRDTYRLCWKACTLKQRLIVLFVPHWLVK